LFLLAALVWISPVQGQISSGGVPHPVYLPDGIPAIDFTGRLATVEEELTTTLPDKKIPLQYALPVQVNIDPLRDGIWATAKDGTRVWRVQLECKEASSLSIIFDRFKLDPGEKVFVFDPFGKQILGAFTSKNNKAAGNLALVPVKGSTAIVSWEIPAGHSPAGKLSVGKIGLGYREIFRDQETKDRFFGSSGLCNIDISCPEGEEWQEEKNSVVRIFVNGTELCSGVLMNTVNSDATPYILTAGHCITDSADAANAVFVFGYESPYCNGPDGSVNKSISGSAFKATGASSLDFTLVQMSRIPPFTYYPYYAGWNSSENTPSSTVTIHHPNGDVKKISIDGDAPGISNYDVYDDSTFWRIKQWDMGTTEPGSSGAPLFDPNHRVIGTLSGGDAHCGSSINDYYQMLAFSWDAYPGANEQVKYWLDPDQLGFPFWNGNDPYAAARKTCDTLTNIADGEILRLYEYQGVDAGYRTGHNEGRITAYADVFYNSELFSMTGIYIMPGIISFDSPADKVTIKIWEGGSFPGEVVVSKDVPGNYFQDSVWNFIDFDTLVTISGNFYAGYEIYYDNPTGALTDQFAVMQAEARNVYGENTAYYYQNGQWTTFSGTPPDYMYTSLAVQPVLCGEIPAVGIAKLPRTVDANAMSIYPNPANRDIVVTFPVSIPDESMVSLTDMTGKVVFSRKQVFSGTRETIHLPPLPDGLYILRITAPAADYRTKLLIKSR